MNKPIAITVLSAAVCVAQFGCQSQADAAPNPKDFFKPDIQYVDGAETFAGPARGYAAGGWTTFKPEGLPNWRGGPGFHSSLWELSRFSGGREQGGKRPPPERVGGADIPLTDAVESRLQGRLVRQCGRRRLGQHLQDSLNRLVTMILRRLHIWENVV
jgi:hypothetical protein